MLERIQIWVAILLLIDGSCGLLFGDRLQPHFPKIRLLRIAGLEIAAAFILLAFRFALPLLL